MEFDVNDLTMTYETGDHLGISPKNSDVDVERFLRVFGSTEKKYCVLNITTKDPTIKIPLPAYTTYDAAARYYLNICAPISRYLLSNLIEDCPNDSTKAALLRLEGLGFR